jgi:hypothetical protein
MNLDGPRLSDRAAAYIEEFVAARPDSAPMCLRLQPSVCWGSGEDTISYDGPHLCFFGREGTAGSATLKDPVSIPVGGCTVLMSQDDAATTRGVFVDLLWLSAPSGGSACILALI